MRERSHWHQLVVAGLLGAALALSGCGSDGSDGAQGPAGPSGPPGFIGDPGAPGSPAAGRQSEACGICHFPGATFGVDGFHGAAQRAPVASSLTITGVSVATGGAITVNFTAVGGDPVEVAESSPADIKFSVISLRTVPTDGQQVWRRDYSRQNIVPANVALVNGNNYTYTIPAASYVVASNDTATHRVNIEWGYTSTNAAYNTRKPVNAAFDFVPPAAPAGELLAAAPAGSSKRVVTTASCLNCHDDKKRPGTTVWNWYYDSNHHNDTRVAIENCNICHNRYGFFTPVTDPLNPDATPNTSYTAYATVTQVNVAGITSNNNSPLAFNMHRRHSQVPREGGAAPSATRLFAGGTYPQDVKNCRTCHDGADPATPEGDNWMNNPSRLACGGCHIDVDFQTGAGHFTGISQANDSQCVICHDGAAIEGYHLTNYQTPNNPNTPAGLLNLAYEIAELTVNQGGQPVVKFRILDADTSAAIDLSAANRTALGLTSSPSFLIAYAAPQDGIAAPADWNNLGRAAGQPQSIQVVVALGDTPTADAQGYYTVTLNGTYPANATMRAVALQGYFSQNGAGRYTKSALAYEAAAPMRRVVVDNAKCLGCHETLQLHGGNRVDEVAVCVMCHNPNLSTSGRGADLALERTGTALAATQATIAALGNDPLLYPEVSNNMKDMIHGIHAAARRVIPYEFVRDRGTSGVFYFDWSHVGYPGNLTNCTKCHLDGFGVEDTPTDGLVSTMETTDGVNATTADVVAARATVPNGTDLVMQPISAACYNCHAVGPLEGHVRTMGGGVMERRLVTGGQ